jgi:hypothetical protein
MSQRGSQSSTSKGQKTIEVDELGKAVVRKTMLPPDVFFQTIEYPSVKIAEMKPIMVNIIQGEDW